MPAKPKPQNSRCDTDRNQRTPEHGRIALALMPQRRALFRHLLELKMRRYIAQRRGTAVGHDRRIERLEAAIDSIDKAFQPFDAEAVAALHNLLSTEKRPN